MEPRRGRLVRPLLEVTREEVREYLRARDLQWREDPSNADPRFARARVRHEVLPGAARSSSPKAERTIAETARQLREEAEVLDIAASDALQAAGRRPRGAARRARRSCPRRCARLVLRRLAESAAGEPRPLSRREAEEHARPGPRAARESLDLGGGLQAVAEYGTLRFVLAREDAGRRPSRWSCRCRAACASATGRSRPLLGGPGEVSVSRRRAWAAGSWCAPGATATACARSGLGGTKSLQDLFTDRKVPRALRRELPVVEAGGEIVWVAGVAVDERFAARGEEAAVGLSARSVG